MAETTINQTTEIPGDYQKVFTEKLEELKHITQNIARNREEIDFLERMAQLMEQPAVSETMPSTRYSIH